MLTLGDRIKHIRDGVLKLNQAKFAGLLGFSRIATICDYEKNKRNPDVETLCKIADMADISLEWLLTGKGIITSKEEAKLKNLKESGKPIYTGDCIVVEVYAISGAGGPKAFSKSDPVDAICVPQKDHKKGTIAVKIEGDSMSPTIVDGAIVGIDTFYKRLVSGKLYAVWLNYEGVTIKRVFVYPDRITLKPDNPMFSETTIPTVNIGEDFIIGSVKWVYQRY